MVSLSSSAPSRPTLAELREWWDAIIALRFDQQLLLDWWREMHFDYPEGRIEREIGRLLEFEAQQRPDRPLPIMLENIKNWATTTRIDGVLPLSIPLASDITTLFAPLIDFATSLGFQRPTPDTFETLCEEMAICLLAWLHGRPLQTDFGMRMELRAECPRSALSARQELYIMATLPYGGRTTIFHSYLKAKCWTDLPEGAIVHVYGLEARRNSSGRLRLYEIPRPIEG